MDFRELVTVDEFSSALDKLLEVEKADMVFDINGSVENAVRVSNLCEILLSILGSRTSQLNLDFQDELVLKMTMIGGMTIQRWLTDIILEAREKDKRSGPG
jgi:hypothetical protein